MELTRRDALAALAGTGILAGGASAALSRERDSSAEDDRTVETLVATAEVVYPSKVSNTRSFVETYAGTKLAERPAFRDGASAAAEYLDERSRSWFDDPFRSLSVEDRETALRQAGADTADSDPEGTDAERLRYYLVNEVLYALYTSPTGGRLAGIENPQGHPGGTSSYQRGPQS